MKYPSISYIEREHSSEPGAKQIYLNNAMFGVQKPELPRRKQLIPIRSLLFPSPIKIVLDLWRVSHILFTISVLTCTGERKHKQTTIQERRDKSLKAIGLDILQHWSKRQFQSQVLVASLMMTESAQEHNK